MRIVPSSAFSSAKPISDRSGNVFRLDINGLRALSVVAVVGFHLKIPSFAGGFVGVDIFLVITGYPMTLKVLRDLAQARFSFLGLLDHANATDLSGARGRHCRYGHCRLVSDDARPVPEASAVASQSMPDCWRVIFWGTSISFRRLFGENLAAVVVEVTDGQSLRAALPAAWQLNAIS